MASTHVDSHLPSHHALVDVVANASLTHTCPDGYTAHIGRQWSSSKCNCRTDCVSTCGGLQVVEVVVALFFDFCRVFICALVIFTRRLIFLMSAISASIAKISKTCCPLTPVACQVNVAAKLDVLMPSCSSDMAWFAALHTQSLRHQILVKPLVAASSTLTATTDSAE